MQRINIPFLFIAGLLLFFLPACKKDIPAKPDPVDPRPIPDTSNAASRPFHFVIDSLPGTPGQDTGLYMIVSIVNKQGQPAVADKKLSLLHNEKYQTTDIKLPAGGYKVSKLLVFDGANSIRYATPVAGSSKAGEVTIPLMRQFTLPDNANSTPVVMQVTGVVAGDTPGDFGYPDGTFPVRPADPQDFTIKIRTVITIGNVVYDSIPSRLTITSWNLQNQPQTVVSHMPAGVNEMLLPSPAVRYKIKVDRWNMSDEILLDANELSGDTVYTLGGSREARKLTAVNTARTINGVYRGTERKTFEYGAQGGVTKIQHYRKNEQYETVHFMTEEVFYNAQKKAARITRQSGSGGSTLSEDTFQYGTDGWLQHMTRTEPEGTTTADVSWLPEPGSAGLTKNYRVHIAYGFSHKYYTQYYSLLYAAGSVLIDELATSHGDHISGNYEYDFNINPYVHLHLPDLYFENTWIHNRVVSRNQYQAVYPEIVPVETSYSYDAEGYPTEKIVTYKYYLSGAFAYREKSVFYY